jgi:inosine-uridine nucleoside N-ribohydrolase
MLIIPVPYRPAQHRMATPVLIDTDLGIDDALALSLALASDAVDLRAVVGVGGNVPLDQVMLNIGRLLTALAPPRVPAVGCGMDQTTAGLMDRRGPYGADGLGECEWTGAAPASSDFRYVYRRAVEEAEGELVLVMLGPLTNLAALLYELPTYSCGIRHVYVSGGAVWTRGHAGGPAEFNFHRDPVAAARVLASGLPITVSPLDVSSLVCVDESHAAHLAASGYRTGEVLARVLRYPLEHDSPPGPGKTLIPDAVALGGLLWPSLFLKTRMRLDVVTEGREAGRCKPVLGGDPAQRIDLLTAVNAADFLENLLESLCHEAFVV